MIQNWIERWAAFAAANPTASLVATRIWRVVLILLVSIAIYLFIRYLLKLFQGQIKRIDGQEGGSFDRRVETITSFLHSLGVLVVVITATLALLDEFSVNIAPLLASVGVAGLALGLGAQTLVKDAIAGLFILIEDQYHVGDVIRVGTLAGAVETLNLRTTRVRDLDGILHIIPNGEIRIVSNLTVKWARARVDVVVPFDSQLDEVFDALNEVAALVALEEKIAPLLQEPFSVNGPEELRDWGLLLRVTAKVDAGKQWDVTRRLRRAIADEFKRRNLEFAVPRQQIVVAAPGNDVQPDDDPLT